MSNQRRKVDLIVDMQFGSTGKGAIAGYLATKNKYDVVINANMPNAGHTFIDSKDQKMIHKVLPNGIVSPKCEYAMIGAGSVFDVDVLAKEIQQAEKFGYKDFVVAIHSNAVVLKDSHRIAEAGMDSIGSTKQGSGAALIEKIKRNPNTQVTVGQGGKDIKRLIRAFPSRIVIVRPNVWYAILSEAKSVLAEGAQGFSLGISEQFYPYCTSRDCTPARFLSDMGIPLPMLNKVIGTARTYPIRVGGISGEGYEDQVEITWKELGLKPELTTVTKKVRRVFSFSETQIQDAINAICPDEVFLNFCNYGDKATRIAAKSIREASGDHDVIKYWGFGAGVCDIVDTDCSFGL
jgi:adenylosuccinate synthase